MIDRASGALVATLLVLTPACTDAAKTSEQRATQHSDRLAKLAASDVEEIRRGLPEGAKRLASGPLGRDALVEPSAARSQLKKMREATPALQSAKSTFFALTDTAGVVLASDQQNDHFAGKPFAPVASDLPRARSRYMEWVGEIAEARGVREGDDTTWSAATPVRASDDAPAKAVLVTGWSMRQFAYHLEQQLKTDLRYEGAGGAANRDLPILYVFVLVGDKPYGAPVTPEVDRKVVEDLHLASKAAAGWHGRIDITGRPFGVAALAVPALGPTAAVVVLRSEI